SVTYRAAPRSKLFPYTTLFRSMGVSFAKTRKPDWQVRTVSEMSRIVCAPITVTNQYRNARRRNRRKAKATTQTATPFARSDSCRSEEHTSELQSRENLVCRLLL